MFVERDGEGVLSMCKYRYINQGFPEPKQNFVDLFTIEGIHNFRIHSFTEYFIIMIYRKIFKITNEMN